MQLAKPTGCCSLILVMVLAIYWAPKATEATADSVVLENNAYRGIVIAINPAIPENLTLLDKLQTIWTDASNALFKATKRRAYFGQITILVPKTWSLTFKRAVGQTYDKADVVVNLPDRLHRNEPYTVQTGRCGDPGDQIFLTPEYIINDAYIEDFGPKGKTLVHEWAHLRWGVFDETSRNPNDSFYLSSAGRVEATRCPASLEGVNLEINYRDGSAADCTYDPDTGLPENATKCQFIPEFDQPVGLRASLMSHQFLEHVDMFCHDDPTDPVNVHNKEAPNDQNRLCNQRSTWEVIMTSPDFAAGNNPPNDQIADVKPVVEIVKQMPFRRFVLVLDVSGSMAGERLVQMRQVVAAFVRQFVPAGDHVGMVQFSSFGRNLYQLAAIETDADRDAVMAKFPGGVAGYTCIGCGINVALSMMEAASADGCGEIIVFTDGEENRKPDVASVADAVLKKKCRMNAIFFTTAGNVVLENLVRASGGKWFFGNTNDIAPIIGAFNAIAHPNDGDPSKQTSEIASNSSLVEPGTPLLRDVTIDRWVGNETKFSFLWSNGIVPPTVQITAPSKCVYSTDAGVAGDTCPGHPLAVVSVQEKSVSFKIPGTALPGKWQYLVTVTSQQKISVTVSSKPSRETDEPIEIKRGISRSDKKKAGCAIVWARVTVGGIPLTGAKVTAEIEKPDKKRVFLGLLDKGAAPDARPNDGIYSRCFSRFTSKGRYILRVTVASQGGRLATAEENVDSRATFNPGVVYGNGSVTLNKNGDKNKPPPESVKETTVDSSDMGDFNRVVTGEGFSFDGLVVDESVDESPPNAISDLVVQQKNMSDPEAGIVLTFSAPGDDFDSGSAARYEVRYSVGNVVSLASEFDSGDLVSELEVAQGSMLRPSSAGDTEKVEILTPQLPANREVVRIAYSVRALDEADNVAEPSNVAVLNLYRAPPEKPTLPPEVRLPTTTPAATRAVTTTAANPKIGQVLAMRQTAACDSIYLTIFSAAYRAACRHGQRVALSAACHSARSALRSCAPNHRELCGHVDYTKACRSAFRRACFDAFCMTCRYDSRQGFPLYSHRRG